MDKFAPGTWQHTMLSANIKALEISVAIISKGSDSEMFTQNELQSAQESLASMIDKTAKAQEGFSQGTSQHTLTNNRVKALSIAEKLIIAEQGGAGNA